MAGKAEAAEEIERKARERGKALPHYARKVAGELVKKRQPRKVTPSKRG
jgi:hypothetical protein